MIGAVGILFKLFDDPRFKGIVLDVVHQRIEIAFVGNVPGFVASLPEVAGTLILFVKVDGVVHIEQTHKFGKGGVVDLYKEMVMDAHQTEVVECDAVDSGSGAEQLFEGYKVRLIEKDFATLYTVVDDVVKAENLEAGFSGQWALF